jgi:hypothetical protein
MTGRNGLNAALTGLRGPPLQPGEQIGVGRPEPVPDLLDLDHVDPTELRQGALGEARRHADPQLPGDKFQKRIAPGRIQPVQPALHQSRTLQARRGMQRLDDLREPRHVAALLARRPDQGNRLRKIADVVIGVPEQHVVDPFHRQSAQHGGLDAGNGEAAGDCGDRIAALGVRDRAEMVDQEPDLAIPAGRQDETVEKGGEALHARQIWGAHPNNPQAVFPAWRDSALISAELPATPEV